MVLIKLTERSVFGPRRGWWNRRDEREGVLGSLTYVPSWGAYESSAAARRTLNLMEVPKQQQWHGACVCLARSRTYPELHEVPGEVLHHGRQLAQVPHLEGATSSITHHSKRRERIVSLWSSRPNQAMIRVLIIETSALICMRLRP